MPDVPEREFTLQQQTLLQELRDVQGAMNELERQLEHLVQQATAAGISQSEIGRQIGRARQVVHARFSHRQRGWANVEDPALRTHGASAQTHTSGPARHGQLVVHIDTDSGNHISTYDGRTRRWDTDPRELLPADLVTRLEEAGDDAQERAVRRHAGTLRRQATIDANGIRVGRPRRDR